MSNSQDYYKASLHNHSTWSNKRVDQRCTKNLADLIDICFQKDVGIFALTDTNTDAGFKALIKDPERYLGKAFEYSNLGDVVLRLDKKKESDENSQTLFFLKGQELHRKAGHLTAIGYEGDLEFSEDSYDVEKAIREIHRQKGIALLDHPFNTLIGGIGQEKTSCLFFEANDRPDGIEAFNAQNFLFMKKYNTQADEFCEEYNVPGIAVPDSHRGEVDLACTYFPKHVIWTDSGKNFINSFRKAIKEKIFFRDRKQEKYLPVNKIITTYLIETYISQKIRKLK